MSYSRESSQHKCCSSHSLCHSVIRLPVSATGGGRLLPIAHHSSAKDSFYQYYKLHICGACFFCACGARTSECCIVALVAMLKHCTIAPYIILSSASLHPPQAALSYFPVQKKIVSYLTKNQDTHFCGCLFCGENRAHSVQPHLLFIIGDRK